MINIFEILQFLVRSQDYLKRFVLLLSFSLPIYLVSFKFVNHQQLGLLIGMPENMRSGMHALFLILIFSWLWLLFEKWFIKLNELKKWLSRDFYHKGTYYLKATDFIKEGIVRDISSNSILEVRSSGAGIISRKGCFSPYEVEFVTEIRNLNSKAKKHNEYISGFGFISHALNHDNYFMLKVDINEEGNKLSVGPLIKKHNILYISTRDIRSNHSVDPMNGEKFQFVFKITQKSVHIHAYKINDLKKDEDIFEGKAVYYLPEMYESFKAVHSDSRSTSSNREGSNRECSNNQKDSFTINSIDKTFFPKLNRFGLRADGPEILQAENLTLVVS